MATTIDENFYKIHLVVWIDACRKFFCFE